MAALAAGAALIWLLSWRARPLLAGLSIGVTLFATIALLLRVNPLARRDGYFLLAPHFGLPDLREQADRKSVVSGKSVSVRGDIGGRRIIKKTIESIT